ncbi:Retrovirus-related Pol polyprotein from transposon TNT 1-94 [Gossypium australe]|uniref:Retrovirus-related Pol polyprotein from transposon TNT 1-94 n=1 Tax=Gossypium australe TaxID=47621 RepID=A0A5B6WJS4_9ROSI|nr:Retrovirus-related Pol polyprotein from transposon TNT 1-94 [Gossypium australe]
MAATLLLRLGSEKEGSNQGDTRHRTRFVAKGYSQVKGVDFDDVFFAVVKHTSTQALLALVASNNLELEQLRVKTTFLHEDLNDDTFTCNNLKALGLKARNTILMYAMVSTRLDISHVVSVKATLQAIVALSTTEAEYMAIKNAVKEAIWLRDKIVLTSGRGRVDVPKT